ncbi:IclR family transcriptional regulator [Pelagibacterium lentulum]|uniref:IclR family transcriptional regulator n=2 Tax=Pelagibacterium lentulum TaxID=2029865 RepID=A0A916RKQ5_9HYPH|nr:IclR family transcriptional regulator [Pelagibacterium lentulum]
MLASYAQVNRGAFHMKAVQQRERTGPGTVAKALSLLDLVASYERPVRFTALLKASALPKATLHRLLQTLTEQRLLVYNEEMQTYGLGSRLVSLAHTAWQQFSLAPLARPYIDALAETIGETIHLAQLDNGHVLYLDKRSAGQPIAMYSQTGKIAPAYCTGVGKAMLAFLPGPAIDRAITQQSFERFTAATLVSPEALEADLRLTAQRGYAIDNQEHEEGIICIAVPILGSMGRLFGAISITGSTARLALSDLEAHLPTLLAAAEQIGKDAQIWQAPS